MRTKEEGERRLLMIEEMAKTLFPLLPGTKDKEWEELTDIQRSKAREAAEKALNARDGLAPYWIDDWMGPQTAREALLMILDEVPQPEAGDYLIKRASMTMIREIAQQGLQRKMHQGWEDQLADRLAEAHKLLREVAVVFGEHLGDEARADLLAEKNPMLDVEIDTALAVPPAVQAVIERRIRHEYSD